MIADIVPFEPGASLARIRRASNGWIIDCRGPKVARLYEFTCEGEAAEFAVMLRDDGNWPLRFDQTSASIEALVNDIA